MKRIFTTIFIILSIPLFIFAQSSTSDTLLKLIKNSSTEVTVDIPEEMAKTFSPKQLDYFKKLPITQQKKLVDIFKQMHSNSADNLKQIQQKLYQEICYPSSSSYNQQACVKLQQNFPQQPAPLPPAPPPQVPQSTPIPDTASPQQSTQPQQSQQPITDDGVKQAFSTPPKEETNCPNFGIKPGSGGGCGGGNTKCLSPKLKHDVNRFCTLTGKPLVIDSGYRPKSCNPAGTGKQHILGKAMDTDFKGWSNEEKVVGVLYFMARCYTGMGVYGASHNIHLDHRSDNTYGGGTMRWGKDKSLKSCKSTPAPQYVEKAFSMMGIDRCDVPDKFAAVEAAQKALKAMGKGNMVPPGTAQQACAGIENPGCNE